MAALLTSHRKNLYVHVAVKQENMNPERRTLNPEP
jgi:hypothetical protein